MQLTIPGFVGGVFHNHICLVVLEVSQRQQDDITLVDPHLHQNEQNNSLVSPGAYKAERNQNPIR